ncbi:MAG: TonB-dependent receptor [Dysgonamonadaceae bacterium]|jgi:hypothetical protein|nr:TonB-dependent receptor [Dysgonamonadaceae bacterium]
MKSIYKIFLFITLLQPALLVAQPVGNIRGVVTDVASGQTLPFVSVVLLHSDPIIGTTTDSEGNFTLNNLPVGRYDIECSFIGFEPSVFREILVTSAREVFLKIAMRENIQELGEVVVRPRVNKEVPLNEMALAGARMLSVEEASRYAGGFDDPARLVTAFAGVAGGMNSNGIAIRGNSPLFLQWRIEGVEAINPTHFSDMTGVGGGILTALSAQVLGNSDFFTGAFPAQYGNALSGVFDMQLRNGNNQNYEYTAQIGTLGVEFASEGPFKKGGRASYLFNYRYSSMALMGDLLPDLVTEAAGMRYQDFTFKMNFPTQRSGTFSVWGIGIKDHYLMRNSNSTDTTKWDNIFEGEGDYRQTKAVGGVGHRIFIGENSYLRSSLSGNYNLNKIGLEHVYTDMSRFTVADMKNTNWNVAFNTYLNTKFSAAHTNRTGLNVTRLFYDLDYWMVEDFFQVPPDDMLNFAKSKGNSTALSAFSQSVFRLNSRLTTSVGLHGMYFRLNEKAVVEPRASIRWQALPRHSFGFAYGKHSRRENTDYYFVLVNDEFVNKNLDFAKAHHFVASYDWSISENLRFKVEPYFQHLYNIPVEKNSVMSIINHRDFWLMNALVNEGKGRNYGIDFTLERYLHGGYYYLFTTSLFESRYTGGDGVWRNTRLNRNFIINALGGKEWKVGRQKQNILGASIRVTLQGGERYIPIDEAASIAEQRIVYNYSHAYEPQLPTELVGHFTVSYKINRDKLTHGISLQMINVTGTKEFDGYVFNYFTNRPERQMGAVVIPNISYKIEF